MEAAPLTPAPNTSRSPILFLAILFAASIPFWVVSSRVGVQFLPGLPLSASMALLPSVVALLLLWRRQGRSAASALLRRCFDFKRLPRIAWLAPVVLIPPLATWAGLALRPDLGPLPANLAVTAMVMFAVFFLSALGEELGWSGYLLEPMEARWGALAAALMIGAVWAAWHVVPFLEAGRSVDWVAWQAAKTVAGRVIMVWLFLNTGRSIFYVSLFHALDNLAVFTSPGYGIAYDPMVTALVTIALAVIVAVRWGPTLVGRDRRAGA